MKTTTLNNIIIIHMASFDTNINNYSISELLTIINLNETDEPDEYTIKTITNQYIDKYKNNPTIYTFFKEVQTELLEYVTSNIESQTKSWIQNQVLPQPDKNQNNKITDRKQQIDIYDNTHVPMNRNQLGINNNFNVDVAQDTLNPNLENKTSRFINLDSQFRQSTSVIENTSTNYTLDLSDPLTNTLKMRLYSYQIPYTWYVIDTAYGNTCFWITDGSYNIPITISPGNYTPANFVIELNTVSFSSTEWTFTPGPPVSYNPNNGKITLNLIGGTYTDPSLIIPSFTINTSTIITFFDYTANLQCENNCVNKSFYIDQTLGWLMGFRVPYINVSSSGNTASAVLDLNGSKYLILVIDDYNQNHINNGLVSIAEYSKTLKMPSYYSPDLPYVCSRALPDSTNIQLLINSNPDNGLLIADKLNTNYINQITVLPSAPRILTQPQIYTINEIIKNNDYTTNYRSKAPTNSDIFAIIPIKVSGISTGALIVEYGGTLQDNKRTYFGPVNIDRMNVKLLDDKGNILNLNGADWCVTIIADVLYQY
jgi:hypothetical protein